MTIWVTFWKIMTSEHFLEVKKCRVTPTPKEWGIPEISTCLRWSQGVLILGTICSSSISPSESIGKKKKKETWLLRRTNYIWEFVFQIHFKAFFWSALWFGECTDCDVKKIAWTICSVRKVFAMRSHQFSIFAFWSSWRWMDTM